MLQGGPSNLCGYRSPSKVIVPMARYSVVHHSLTFSPKTLLGLVGPLPRMDFSDDESESYLE